MLRIGLNKSEKEQEIQKLIKEKNIKKTYIFYFKKFKTRYEIDSEVEYIEYNSIIMYKYFYRLLEEIESDSLIVCDCIMRTQNRSDLTYNCMHHYLNQTENRLVFEYFPIIDKKENMMILIDLNTPNKYKGKGFSYDILQEEDIKIKPIDIKINWIDFKTTDKQKSRYERNKDSLFDNLGNKDPDTIPRKLQLLVGDFKKELVEEDKIYIARNKRHKLDNVFSYNDKIEKKHYIVIDTHYRRLDFNDFLRKTEMTTIDYISTDLSIDNVIKNSLMDWKERCEGIYAKANLY